MPTQPGKKSQAEYDEEAGGYNEASEAFNLGRADRPPPRPTPPSAKPKPKSPDRPYKKVSPDRPYKKMASGGSVRGKGCETKGFGKGTMR